MEKQIEPQLNNKEAKDLYLALARLEKPQDIAEFLRDLLTLKEIEEAIRRFEVAKLLDKGETFRQIVSQTGMSSTTIARINYWLHHGTRGYRSALRQLNSD